MADDLVGKLKELRNNLNMTTQVGVRAFQTLTEAIARLSADDGMVRVPREVVEFLNGESSLDGCWYGERTAPDPRKPFWWREYLNDPTLLAAAPVATVREDAPVATDPMENWLMKPALEWLEQAEHGGEQERCKRIAELLRDLWRMTHINPPPTAGETNAPAGAAPDEVCEWVAGWSSPTDGHGTHCFVSGALPDTCPGCGKRVAVKGE